MAIIKCPKCANQISSIAEECPNCGYPIKEELKKQDREKEEAKKRLEECKLNESLKECPECKAVIESSNEKCPKCGYPIKKQQEINEVQKRADILKKRQIAIIVCTVAIVLVVLGLIFRSVNGNKIENRLVGQWETSNMDSTWIYEFNKDKTGQFLGYGEDNDYPASQFDFSWSVDEDKKQVTIVNEAKGEEQNSLKNIDFIDDNNMSVKGYMNSKTMIRKHVDIDAIISSRGTIDNTKTKKTYRRGSEPEIGMSETDVKMSSWGTPDEINKTETEYGISEQWVYDNKGYIYLEDGIVSAIQE